MPGGYVEGGVVPVSGRPTSEDGEVVLVGANGELAFSVVSEPGGESRERSGPVWVREWIHCGSLISWLARSRLPSSLPRSSPR